MTPMACHKSTSMSTSIDVTLPLFSDSSNDKDKAVKYDDWTYYAEKLGESSLSEKEVRNIESHE